jgi:hypothetical protein
MDRKQEIQGFHAPVLSNSLTEDESSVTFDRLGTAIDQADMYRMGKEQKLRVGLFESSMATSSQDQRNFGFFSIFGFSAILLSTWEAQIGYVGQPVERVLTPSGLQSSDFKMEEQQVSSTCTLYVPLDSLR